MSYVDLNLKKTYSTDYDDILNEFYIPVLKESIEYCRLAGFFSSTSFAIAARGILGLIHNNGCMKMIISPRLNEKDLETIISSYCDPEQFFVEKIIKSLEYFENEFVRSHLYALGWMIANKKLFIKVAVPEKKISNSEDYNSLLEYGIFHQKVGIFKNLDGEVITFSGSINESAIGWLGNIEEFKVFKNWEKVETDFASSDIEKFERFWTNRANGIKVIDIPRALEERFIEIAPDDIKKIDFDGIYKKYFPQTRKQEKDKIILFPHQLEAIESWVNNNYQGIFEMATGTGKTFTALGCLNSLYNKNERLAVIISAPYQHLVQQWKGEIDKFNLEFDEIIISGSYKWKDNLFNSLTKLSLRHISKLIILITHDSLCSIDFTNIINNCKYDSKIFLIADEVHGIGSKERKKGLLESYEYRLGLSATPKRWFDELGSQKIYDYFNKVVFEFTLKDAITKYNPVTGKTFLTPYKYIPKFIQLNDEELYEYYKETTSIIKLYNKKNQNKEEPNLLDMLIFKRANIVKNASMKFDILEDILNEIIDDIKWTIIYCTPQQINEVVLILKKYKLISHRFTEAEGTKPEKIYKGISEREYILKNFAESRYDVLVAMKCLDEGVDVPPARKAILMASSGNPREYIQRIGRIIRRYKDKEYATLYDLIVVPSSSYTPPEIKEIEKKIFEKEIKRCIEIAKNSKNSAEAIKIIRDLKY